MHKDNCKAPFCRECLNGIKDVMGVADKLLETPEPIESLDDLLYSPVPEQYEDREAWLSAYITERELKAQQRLIRNIKNSEGYGKMPVGMRDLLSDFSHQINAQLQSKEQQDA